MKESPEYNFPRAVSEQNYQGFKENVAQCFNRSYLREIWSVLMDSKNESTNQDKDLIAESNTALDIAWELIKSDYLDFGFLTLYQCIESYANKIFNYDDVSDTYEIDGTITIDNINTEENEWILTH